MAKVFNVIFVMTMAMCVLRVVSGMPRDASVPIKEDALQINEDIYGIKNEETTKTTEAAVKIVSEHNHPGRVSCRFEEATEDTVCQEHCLPKGYSYGICTSYTCSCI